MSNVKTVVNYAKKWKQEIKNEALDSGGNYPIAGELMAYDDSVVDEIEESYPGFKELPLIEFNGFQYKVMKIDEPEKVSFVWLYGEEAPEITEFIEFCRQHDIGMIHIDLDDAIIAYAKQASADDSYNAYALNQFVPELSSILVLMNTTGNILIEDLAGKQHSYKTFHVAMIGETVYDIKHGFFGINVYEYFERLYKTNDTLTLMKGPTGIAEEVMNRWEEDNEWKFWGCLMGDNAKDGPAELQKLIEKLKQECNEQVES